MKATDDREGEAINQKVSFDPEITRAMALAFDRACDAIGLEDHADPIMSRLIADKIIDFAQCGERDPDKLCALTMRALACE
jgi:hypothetical protein